MRALLVILVAMAMLIGVATQPASAGKGTDIEQFIKRIGKVAGDASFTPKPRGVCVCQDGGPYHTEVGALTYFGQLGDTSVSVQCLVQFFNGVGAFTGSGTCNTFEILSK